MNTIGQRELASTPTAVCRAVGMFAELVDLVDVKAFELAWIQYFAIYHSGRRADTPRLERPRMTDYVAWKKQDIALARRAWREFVRDGGARTVRVGRARSFSRSLAQMRIVEVAGIGDDDTERSMLACERWGQVRHPNI